MASPEAAADDVANIVLAAALLVCIDGFGNNSGGDNSDDGFPGEESGRGGMAGQSMNQGAGNTTRTKSNRLSNEQNKQME